MSIQLSRWFCPKRTLYMNNKCAVFQGYSVSEKAFASYSIVWIILASDGIRVQSATCCSDGQVRRSSRQGVCDFNRIGKMASGKWSRQQENICSESLQACIYYTTKQCLKSQPTINCICMSLVVETSLNFTQAVDKQHLVDWWNPCQEYILGTAR